MKLLVLCAFLLHAIKAQLVVETTNGVVSGAQNETVTGTVYYSFRGIPYAQPPLGVLRFASPLPANNWTGILDGTNERSMCVQFINQTIGSEDCLFINVYTPSLPANGISPNLSVMVWIHGGYFLEGSGNYDEFGPDYLLNENIIYVSLNYRLGIFGFLSTSDDAASGNAGLKDQLLALQWVQHNIRNFGGDPNKVTIFGESAGSASVSYLAQSPRARGLYQRAIMQSGTCLCLWSYSRQPRRAAFAVGVLLGIITTSSTELVRRLRLVNYRFLSDIATGSSLAAVLARSPLAGFIFAPVTEPASSDAVLAGRSHQLLEQGYLNNATYFIGFNSLEGKFFADVLNNLRFYLLSYDINPTRLVPVDMNIQDRQDLITVATDIRNEYFRNELIALSEGTLLEFLSDDQFVRPIREYIRIAALTQNIYMYMLTYEGYLGSDDRSVIGVGHSEDLNYIFRTSRDALQIPYNDLIVRHRMVRMWTNFAKTGNPTPVADNLLQNITVPLSTLSNNFTFVNIGQNLLIDANPYDRSYNFYRQLYLTYGRPPYDTY